MESLSKLAALCSEITVILAALAMLIKPIRNKLLGLDKLTDALKCQLRHDMLHTYYLSLIHISEPTRHKWTSRMPSSA